MCPPIIGAIVPALSAIGTAASTAVSSIAPALSAVSTVASTAMGAYGAISQGQQAKAQAEAQAAMYKRQAVAGQMQAQYQIGRKQDEVNQVTGAQLASVAGSGVTMDGSPSDAIAATASEGALDMSAIRWNADVQSNDLMYQAKMSQIQGKNAMKGAYLSAAGSIIGGIGKLGDQIATFGNPFASTKTAPKPAPKKPPQQYPV